MSVPPSDSAGTRKKRRATIQTASSVMPVQVLKASNQGATVMAVYQSPGVYVEEVPSPVKAIAGVGTSVAGFVGIVGNTVNLPARNPSATPPVKIVKFNVPTPEKKVVQITNWTEFVNAFGDLLGKEDGEEAEEGATVDAAHRNLAQAVFGFFSNGGSRCFVVRVASAADLDAALDLLDAIDEIALVCAPGQTGNDVRDKLIARCEALQDRFAILDGPGPQPADLTTLADSGAGGQAPKNSNYAAWYYPWLNVFDPAARLANPTGDATVAVPPSGHVAGIYARVDTQRGVFKSPGNEVVRGALSVTHPLSKPQQDPLNLKGVNCIRPLNGAIYVWGARTVGGDANADLKYISTRRTLAFLRESIDEGLQWAVFEPHTPALWAKISRNVTDFLTTFWRAGGLFGTTPQEAFFVKCDAENNPPSERELGKVITDVGVAIVRPAEFVIFRVSQLAPAK